RREAPAPRLLCLLEGGEKHDRLEDRPGLALRVGHPVELALRVGTAADHRLDLAGVRLHREQCRLQRLPLLVEGWMALLERGQAARNRRLRFALEQWIERGEDAEALAGERVGRIILVELTAHVVDEVRRVGRLRRRAPLGW